MTIVPDDLLTTSFPALLEDYLQKCQFQYPALFTYHEHPVDDDNTDYCVSIVVRANESPTSWFFDGPRMSTLGLAVEAAAQWTLAELRDLLPEFASEPATQYLPAVKKGNKDAAALEPPKEDGLPLRFQTYYGLAACGLVYRLFQDVEQLREELHDTMKRLHRT